MSTRYLRDETLVLRSRAMFWLVLVVEAILLCMVVSLVILEGPMALITTAVPWYLLGAALWWFLVMPHVQLTEHRIVVVNPVKTHTLKYADLVDVDTRYGLHLITRHRKIQAVGAPAGGAASMMWSNRESMVQGHPEVAYRGPERTIMPSDFRNTASGRAAEVIRGHWQEQVESGTLDGTEAEPVSTWNVRALSILAALLVLSLVVLAV